MAEHPEQHRWSGIHANAGFLQDELVTPHSTFLDIGRDPIRRALAYQTWLHQSVSDDELQQIRSHIKQQRALADSKFQAMVEKALGHSASVRPRASHPKPNPELPRSNRLRPFWRWVMFSRESWLDFQERP